MRTALGIFGYTMAVSGATLFGAFAGMTLLLFTYGLEPEMGHRHVNALAEIFEEGSETA